MTPLILVLGSLSLAAPSDPIPIPVIPGPVMGPVVPFTPPPPAAAAAPNTRAHESTLKHLTACEGSPLQPFLRLPAVRSVGPCVAGADGTPTDWSGYWVQEFHRAAHFPIPRYTLMGQFDSRDGLLIYEGMRLTVNEKTGVYDVEFTATVPSTPVTIHLQLIFKPLGDLRIESEHRLTLPPIRLEPPVRAALGDPAGNTFQVNHRGYSSLFRKDFPPSSSIPMRIDSTWEVGRVGTARFGTPVAVDDLGR